MARRKGMKLVPQASFEEIQIEDENLESTLDRRARLKGDAGNASKLYRESDEDAKSRIRTKELSDGTYRCGRYVITIEKKGTRSVTFETKPRTHIGIKTAKEGESDG